MVNVIIPVYNARETLPKTLDSLVAQTSNRFFVTLVQDSDGLDYTDIFDKYKKRLQLNLITLDANVGPGMARQIGVEYSKMFDYIMFLDADDMLNPRAVEVLYTEAKRNDYDILSSAVIKEPNITIAPLSGGLQWIHGKIYRRQYLVDNKITFLPDIRLNEDSYFNQVAHGMTEKSGIINEVLYIWRENKDSLTRIGKENEEFFRKSNADYIKGMCRAIKKLDRELENPINPNVVCAILINLYNNIQKQFSLKIDDFSYTDELKELINVESVRKITEDLNTYNYLLDTVKQGQITDNKVVIFYKQRFVDWFRQFIGEGVL